MTYRTEKLADMVRRPHVLSATSFKCLTSGGMDPRTLCTTVETAGSRREKDIVWRIENRFDLVDCIYRT